MIIVYQTSCILQHVSWIVIVNPNLKNPKSTSSDSKNLEILKFEIRIQNLSLTSIGDLKSGVALREEFIGARVKTIQVKARL